MKKLCSLFRQATADELAKSQLEQCEIDLLRAQEAAEYWSHTVNMLKERNRRLNASQGVSK